MVSAAFPRKTAGVFLFALLLISSSGLCAVANESSNEASVQSLQQARGFLEKAYEQAMLIRMDGTYQLDLVLAIARAYTAADDAATAESIVPEGQTIRTRWHIFKTNYTDRLNHYRTLALYHTRAGRFRIVQEILEELHKDDLLGTPEQRQEHARNIKRDVANHAIDYYLTKKDVNSALREAQGLPARLPSGVTPRDKAYKKIVHAQWQWGDMQGARKNASLLTSSWNRNELRKEFVEFCADAGDTDQALHLCSLLSYPRTKIAALIDVADALAAKGNKAKAIALFREATELAMELVDYFRPPYNSKASALCDIARHQFSVDKEGALANIAAAKGNRAPPLVFIKVAATEAHCGLIDQARATCESINSPQIKYQAYCEVARACARVEHQQATRNCLRQAVEEACKVQGHWVKENAILETVKTCADLNEMRLATEGAEKLELRSLRGEALLAIVCGHARDGHLRQAKAIRDRIDVAHLRRKADQCIVNVKIKEGDFTGAFEIARKLDGAEFYETMESLIKAQIAARDYTGAAVTAKTIHTVGVTDKSLRKIAKAQSRFGDTTGALALISEKNRRMENAYVYLGIAEGLIEKAYGGGR